MKQMFGVRETEPSGPVGEQLPAHGVFVIDEADLDEVSGAGGRSGGVFDDLIVSYD
jgi:hypothetical protein